MKKLSFAAVLFSLIASTGAMAQQQHGGTAAEQKACARDVTRFCRKVMEQGDFAVLACLQQSRPKISGGCDQVLRSHGQ